MIFSKLKQARELLNLTQGGIAEAVSTFLGADNEANTLSQKEVSKLENGQRAFIPNGYIAFLLQKGIDINSLYDDSIERVSFVADQGYTPSATDLEFEERQGFTEISPTIKGQNASENASPSESPTQKSVKIGTNKQPARSIELTPNYGATAPAVITIDASGQDNILYVPVRARAGYLVGYGDPEFIQSLPTFRFPGLNNAQYRMFEVEGLSMSPNIKSSDRIIGEWVESLDDIRENRVHVIVTKSGITVKRVLNRVAQRGKLVLKSDTIEHRLDHPTYEVNAEEVQEIWYARLKISADFTEPEEFYNRLNDLETDVDEMKRLYTELAAMVRSGEQPLQLATGKRPSGRK